jgi:hypothetical protein
LEWVSLKPEQKELLSPHLIGMFHNPEQSNYGALAYQYITLSRAAMAVECVFVNTSITAIDCMLLHIGYLERSDDPGGEAKSWAALGTAIKLAQAVSNTHAFVCFYAFYATHKTRIWNVKALPLTCGWLHSSDCST